MKPVDDQGARRAELSRLPDAAASAWSAKNLPMVLLVHGGPWARDTLGLQPEAQWLANRGYAVLQVELPRLDGLRQEVPERRRQASGAGKMHDDLIDAVEVGR